MNKFKVINFEGVNYYNVGHSRTVNMTYEEVNANNYGDVADFNCFTVKDVIKSVEELECEVMSFVACDKLNGVILKDIQNLDGISFDDALTIVSNIDRTKAIRESFVLANYSSLDVECKLLNIYDLNGNGISIDFRKGITLGSIVG